MKKFMLSLGLIFAISVAALAQTPSQAPTSASSQNSLTDQVDKIFAEYDKPNSPGCALAIIKDGRIVYKRGYGMANLDYNMNDELGNRRFTRDEQKLVSGFRLNSTRIKHLWFAKERR